MTHHTTLDSAQLFEEVQAQHVPHESHYSDLYLPVNDQTRALIRRYTLKGNVTTFQSQIDKKVWYDVPFAYTPYWEARMSNR